jgi:YebC/PmpR family DNA-binding regulatory protein
MGAQWKHSGRIENSSKRSALVGKLAKEIIVAARIGDPNPENNSRLRAAVEAAKKASVPRETIERSIKRGAGLLEPISYETVVYEGFAPHKVALIIECLTDNKNRTASDIRMIFRKGQLGAMGSVGFLFDRMGVVEATHLDKALDPETAAIEAGAQNVEALEAHEVPVGQVGARFFTELADLDSVTRALAKLGWTVTLSELSYIPKSVVELSPEAKKEVVEFLESLDDNDDVHRIYAAIKN